MPLTLTPEQSRVVRELRADLARGARPLIDHALIAETTTKLAAGSTGSAIIVRPYENGIIVSLDGQAYAPGGEAEADTMAERMHEKYMGALVTVAGRPKTNETYEPIYLLTPKAVCWVVAQNDAISVTFKHLATAGIADLHAKIAFGFLPFSELGV